MPRQVLYRTGSGLVSERRRFGKRPRPGSTRDFCSVWSPVAVEGDSRVDRLVGCAVARDDAVGGDHESDMRDFIKLFDVVDRPEGQVQTARLIAAMEALGGDSRTYRRESLCGLRDSR